jgi:hypothetical protein
MVIRAIENSADKKENSFSHDDWSLLRIFLSTYRKLLLQVRQVSYSFGFDFKAMQKKHIKGMREVGK